METFGKLTSLLLHALETREPSVDLLQSFVDHWKAITNYYIETTDETRAVRQTDIPWRLKQLLDILLYEEREQGVEETGPCLEYLLQHKILETLCTLGKAQYPPGMCQQVLLFASRLLSQMQKPLLHLINVYRPVQKLIRLCALPGSQTEKEEAQFLLVVCSRVKQDPYVLNYILELPDHSPAKTPCSGSDQSEDRKHTSNHKTETVVPSNQSNPPISPSTSASGPCKSESPVSSPGQSESSNFSRGLSESSASSTGQSESSTSSPGQSDSGLVYALIQLTRSQKPSVCLKAHEGVLLLVGLGEIPGRTLAERSRLSSLLAGRLLQLHSLLPQDTLQPQDLQGWTQTAWSSQFSGLDHKPLFPGSDHVNRFFCWLDFLDHLMKEAPQVLAVKLAQAVHASWLLPTVRLQLLRPCERDILLATSLLCALVRLVGSDALLDQLVLFLLGTHTLKEQLLHRCDHISDQISMASLCLVEELLRKPHRDILTILVLRHLETRSYLAPPSAGLEERQVTATEENEDLEEDPFFSDQLLLPPPLSSSAPPPCGLGPAADVVNSFLCLVPPQARSAHLLQEGGYDSYVHDAHSLVKECMTLSDAWDWPVTLPPPPSSSSADFDEGLLLKVLLDRLGRILEQPYELNLQLTSLLSRLSAFSHPLLQEYLLNPYINLSHCARSPFSVLIRVIGELMQRIQLVPSLADRLLNVRKQLLGLDHTAGLEHLTLLRGLIVLEEFCKELAAIAFVKLPLDQD